MKELKHDQIIYAKEWGTLDLFQIGTAKEYYGEGDEVFVCRLADIISTRKEKDMSENAITVKNNEIVLIDNKQYKINLIGKNYSDGIHFILQ